MMIGLVALIALQGPPVSVLKYKRGSVLLSKNGGPFVPISDPLMGCDVEDTTLDNSEPTVAEGGLYSLSGGMGKTILIRFGQLQRYLGAGAKVVDAQLILTQSSPDTPQLSLFSRVLKVWGEGPALTLNLPKGAPSDTAKAQPNSVTKAPIGGATWSTPEFGIRGAKWDVPGAIGPNDNHPLIVKGHPTGIGTFAVEGLGPSLQDMVEHPWLNYGFALQFSGPCEFSSSEDAQACPELDITFTPADAPTPAAGDLEIASVARVQDPIGGRRVQITILNRGKTASAATSLIELQDGLAQPSLPIPTLAPGATTTLTTDYVESKDDQRAGALRFWVAGPEASSSEGSTLFYPNAAMIAVGTGKDANWANREALLRLGELCNVELNRSRFSFSPAGSLARVEFVPSADLAEFQTGNGNTLPLASLDSANANQVTALIKAAFHEAGATDFGKEQIAGGPLALSQESGFFGGGTLVAPGQLGGDRRYEGQLPPSLQLPQQAFQVPYVMAAPTAPFGPLGAVTIGQMNDMLTIPVKDRNAAQPSASTSFPRLILVRAFGGNGFNLKGQDLDFYRVVDGKVSPAPEFTLKTDDSGSVILPNRPIASGGAAKNPFGTNRLEGAGSFAVKAKLGATTAWALLTAGSILETNYRGNTGVAFADLRFALPVEPIDTTHDFAADAAMTPGTAGDGNQLGDNWAEWDLHRDRPLGEIDIVFSGQPNLDQIKIMVYNTGDTIKNAMAWATEPDMNWTYINRGEPVEGGVLVRYFGPVVTARFIRVVGLGKNSLNISKIGVYSPIVTQK